MSRILLLEDDAALGRGICMALEAPGRTVTHCGTCLQATDRLRGAAFDLLIFDVNLPDGSGLELLRDTAAEWRRYARHFADSQRPGTG